MPSSSDPRGPSSAATAAPTIRDLLPGSEPIMTATTRPVHHPPGPSNGLAAPQYRPELQPPAAVSSLLSRRPSSAPGSKHNSSSSLALPNGAGSSESPGATLAPPSASALQPRPSTASKPMLLRSKSDYVGMLAHTDSDDDDDSQPGSRRKNPYSWGARHGFGDHYESEDIISQLVNVSSTSFHRYSPTAFSSSRLRSICLRRASLAPVPLFPTSHLRLLQLSRRDGFPPPPLT